MSTNPETETTIDHATHTDQPAPEGTAPEEDRGKNPHREAAKYRTRLREAEGERESLTAQLDAVRSEMVRTHLSQELDVPAPLTAPDGTSYSQPHSPDGTPKHHTVPVTLRNPEDLFTIGGVDPTTLWTEEGNLDTEAINTALSELHEARPELFHQRQLPLKTIGHQPDSKKLRITWKDALQSTKK